jgi:hypothetical protein
MGEALRTNERRVMISTTHAPLATLLASKPRSSTLDLTTAIVSSIIVAFVSTAKNA